MFSPPSPLRIAIYGSEVTTLGRGVGLWSIGYKGAVTAAGARGIVRLSVDEIRPCNRPAVS